MPAFAVVDNGPLQNSFAGCKVLEHSPCFRADSVLNTFVASVIYADMNGV